VRRAVLTIVVLLALAGAGVAAAYVVLWRQETIPIVVQGADEKVATGATLGEAADRFSLHPEAGDLLDVQGDVLRTGEYPGQILVNGRAVPSTTELVEGDAIRVSDGEDRREPSSMSFVRIRAGMPADPQFTLARTPGEQELERGRISGKIVPSGFHATGPSRTPKAVALTFDDGPSPYTPRILNVLARLHARATFFVIGQQAKAYPRLVRRELAAGMEVGSHSYSHPYQPPFDRQPHAMILQEIERGRSVVADLGRPPTLFRPPGGSFSPYVVEAAGSFGERIVLWNVDPTDWRAGTTSSQITRRVLGAVRPGSIVVLHDGGGDRSATIQALSRIIRGIRRMGLQLAPIDPERIGAG
jgi:peptidoglycan/xylan/chitin deacetylase (PgdA/CDA1 family)